LNDRKRDESLILAKGTKETGGFGRRHYFPRFDRKRVRSFTQRDESLILASAANDV